MILRFVTVIVTVYIFLFFGLRVYAQKLNYGLVKNDNIYRLEVYQDKNNIKHGIIYVSGVGVSENNNRSEGQQRLLAKRAAKIDAYRKIMMINKKRAAKIKDGNVHYDGYINGMAIVNESFSAYDGKAYVNMVLFTNIDGFIEGALSSKGIPIKLISESEYSKKYKKAIFITEDNWRLWCQN